VGAPDKPVVVYPNSGELYDENHKCWDGISDHADFGTAAIEWFNHGAKLLGGCCRTSPNDIAHMEIAVWSLWRGKGTDTRTSAE